jgi:hypothetical protein
VPSLRQAWHALKLQDKPQGNDGAIDVTAPNGCIHLSRDMTPGIRMVTPSSLVCLDESSSVGLR